MAVSPSPTSFSFTGLQGNHIALSATSQRGSATNLNATPISASSRRYSYSSRHEPSPGVPGAAGSLASRRASLSRGGIQVSSRRASGTSARRRSGASVRSMTGGALGPLTVSGTRGSSRSPARSPSRPLTTMAGASHRSERHGGASRRRSGSRSPSMHGPSLRTSMTGSPVPLLETSVNNSSFRSTGSSHSSPPAKGSRRGRELFHVNSQHSLPKTSSAPSMHGVVESGSVAEAPAADAPAPAPATGASSTPAPAPSPAPATGPASVQEGSGLPGQAPAQDGAPAATAGAGKAGATTGAGAGINGSDKGGVAMRQVAEGVGSKAVSAIKTAPSHRRRSSGTIVTAKPVVHGPGVPVVQEADGAGGIDRDSTGEYDDDGAGAVAAAGLTPVAAQIGSRRSDVSKPNVRSRPPKSPHGSSQRIQSLSRGRSPSHRRVRSTSSRRSGGSASPVPAADRASPAGDGATSEASGASSRHPAVKRLPALDKLKDAPGPEAQKSPLAKIGALLNKGRNMLRFKNAAKTVAKTRHRRRSSIVKSGVHSQRKGIHTTHTLDLSLRCVIEHKGQVWASTRDSGVQVLNAETGAMMYTVDIPANTFVWCMVSVGRFVWCGTETGTILVYHGTTRKLVKKCLHHNGGVYALTTNRIVLPRKAELAAPFLGLTAQMESSKTVIDRVMKANVPDNGLDRSPLRLGRGTPTLPSAGSPAGSPVFGSVPPTVDTMSPPRLATPELHAGDEAGAGAGEGSADIPNDTPYRLVWSASADFTVVAWDVQGRFVQAYSGHGNQVRCLCVVGSHLWSGSDDKTIRVWDVTRANKCIGVLHGHEAGVVSLAHVTRDVWKPDEHDARARGTTPTGQQMFSPAGQSTSISGDLSTAVVSGGMDGSIRIWHGTSMECIRVVDSVSGRVAASLVMGNNQIWCGDASGDIHVFSAKDDFRLVKTMDGHQKFLSGMVSVLRRETRVVWSYSAGEASTKVWTQTFDVSDQVDPEEYLAEISQLQLLLSQTRNDMRRMASEHRQALIDAKVELNSKEEELEQERTAHQATRDEREDIRKKMIARAKINREVEDKEAQAGEPGQSVESALADAQAEIARLQAAVVHPDTDADKELVRLRQEALEREREMAALKEKLAVSQQKLTKVTKDLSEECRLSLKMQTRLASMDENKLRELERRLADARLELNGKIRELTTLQNKYDALDVFKLDKIARRLNALKTCVNHAETAQHSFNLGDVRNPGDRQVVGNIMHDIAAQLSTCKKEVAAVINDCLTGTLKFHIGAPADGDGELAGPDYEAVMNAGGTAEYAAKHNRRNSGGGGGSSRRRSSIHRDSRRSFTGGHSRRNSGSRSPSFYDNFDASLMSEAGTGGRGEGNAMTGLPASSDFDV